MSPAEQRRLRAQAALAALLAEGDMGLWREDEKVLQDALKILSQDRR